MTETQAYNHGYNGTLTLEELLEQFPAQPHNYDEPPQLAEFKSGAEDAAHDAESDASELGSYACDRDWDDSSSGGDYWRNEDGEYSCG